MIIGDQNSRTSARAHSFISLVHCGPEPWHSRIRHHRVVRALIREPLPVLRKNADSRSITRQLRPMTPFAAKDYPRLDVMNTVNCASQRLLEFGPAPTHHWGLQRTTFLSSPGAARGPQQTVVRILPSRSSVSDSTRHCVSARLALLGILTSSTCCTCTTAAAAQIVAATHGTRRPEFVNAAIGAGGRGYAIKSRMNVDLRSAVKATLSHRILICAPLQAE